LFKIVVHVITEKFSPACYEIPLKCEVFEIRLRQKLTDIKQSINDDITEGRGDRGYLGQGL
jgi:hypothetical protein